MTYRLTGCKRRIEGIRSRARAIDVACTRFQEDHTLPDWQPHRINSVSVYTQKIASCNAILVGTFGEPQHQYLARIERLFL